MPQLDHLALPPAQLLETIQSVVESDQLFIFIGWNMGVLFGFLDNLEVRAALRSLPPPCIIDQDAPHQRGCHADKVSAIPPVSSLVAHQPDIGFIHQSCGLQRVPGPFRPQV